MTNKCPRCNNESIIKIATSDEILFYSCYTEGCIWEATLLVDTGDGDFMRYDKLFDMLMKIVREDEQQTDNTEGES